MKRRLSLCTPRTGGMDLSLTTPFSASPPSSSPAFRASDVLASLLLIYLCLGAHRSWRLYLILCAIVLLWFLLRCLETHPPHQRITRLRDEIDYTESLVWLSRGPDNRAALSAVIASKQLLSERQKLTRTEFQLADLRLPPKNIVKYIATRARLSRSISGCAARVRQIRNSTQVEIEERAAERLEIEYRQLMTMGSVDAYVYAQRAPFAPQMPEPAYTHTKRSIGYYAPCDEKAQSVHSFV
ncbi:hypothetical protein MKEN_01312100 [Mycena kentingensis (nom. inval.)]|nr:hypothetical protein MKEN_01312100 [Mycena kentingensis (nom. inval.)]